MGTFTDQSSDLLSAMSFALPEGAGGEGLNPEEPLTCDQGGER